MRSFLLACCAVSVAAANLPLATSPASAAVADAKSKARKEFQALWRERLEGYRTKYEAALTKQRLAAEAFNRNAQEAAPGTRVQDYAAAVTVSGEMNGRGSVLTDFLVHMEKKPSLGLTRAWLQGQFDVAREIDEEGQRLGSAAMKIGESEHLDVLRFLVAMEAALLKRGDALGRAEELVLLVDNFGAYADEYASADARDRQSRLRLGQALGAFAAGLRADPGWTAQCVRMGPHVTCSGR